MGWTEMLADVMKTYRQKRGTGARANEKKG